jgi:hypothetical protein
MVTLTMRGKVSKEVGRNHKTVSFVDLLNATEMANNEMMYLMLTLARSRTQKPAGFPFNAPAIRAGAAERRLRKRRHLDSVD